MTGEKGGSDKLTPILVVASIFLAFAVGILWQKVSSLEGGSPKTTAGTKVNPTGAANPAAAAPSQGKLTGDQVKNIPAVSDSDHIRGSEDAQIFLIEYSDYECPYCSRFHPTAQQVVDEYQGKVAWVYRHYPLDQLHPNARPLAEASECVAELGGSEAFWKFTDAAYTEGAEKSISALSNAAGVDAQAVQSCVDSDKYADAVESQLQGGITAGVRGTPGNLIVNRNGEAWLIPGALPFETLKATIDEALGS